MNTRERMIDRLIKAFAPERVEVIDESHLHAGHAGSRPGGETHYRVRIVAETFRGKSRIDRHRMVNAALADELAGGVHALAIHASAPGEGMA
jgi:BolA protein